MTDKKEMTAPNVSVGADTEQSIQKCTDNSITDYDENIKDLDESFREMQREMLRQMNPSYLKTVSMSTLYDTDFETQTALRMTQLFEIQHHRIRTKSVFVASFQVSSRQFDQYGFLIEL